MATMHIGALTVALVLHEGASLKDKRHVVRSLVETTRRKFNVSIAEIADLNAWRRATIGIVAAANDQTYVNRVLDKVLDSIEANPEVEVVEVSMEML